MTFEVTLREVTAPDVPYVRRTWLESSHRRRRRMTWADYKRTFGALIDGLLAREDVRIIAARDTAGRVAGWVAFIPGPIVTLLYVYTRHVGDWRRRGLATVLLEAAQIGARVVYAFRGPEDWALLQLAKRRGVHAAYVPAGISPALAPDRLHA